MDKKWLRERDYKKLQEIQKTDSKEQWRLWKYQEYYKEEHGPIVLSGHGMDSQHLLKALESDNKFTIGQKKPDKSEFRGQLATKLNDTVLKRQASLLELSAASSDNNFKEITGMTKAVFEHRVQSHVNAAFRLGQKSLDYTVGVLEEHRNKGFYNAVAQDFMLQRYEYDLKNYERVKQGKGRLNNFMLHEACQQLRDTQGTDHRAIYAIQYEIQRSGVEFNKIMAMGKPDQFKDMQRAYEAVWREFNNWSTILWKTQTGQSMNYEPDMISSAPEKYIECSEEILEYEIRAKNEKHIFEQTTLYEKIEKLQDILRDNVKSLNENWDEW